MNWVLEDGAERRSDCWLRVMAIQSARYSGTSYMVMFSHLDWKLVSV